MTDLLPCPFCGGDATLSHGATDDFAASCHNRNCFGPRTGGYAFSSDAIAAWNRRATPAGVTVPDYDAGLLNDYGGGNIDWWQDYLRAEIERANEHWRSHLTAALCLPQKILP